MDLNSGLSFNSEFHDDTNFTLDIFNSRKFLES